MEPNNSPDEIFEIKPDDIDAPDGLNEGANPIDEDDDITIAVKSPRTTEGVGAAVQGDSDNTENTETHKNDADTDNEPAAVTDSDTAVSENSAENISETENVAEAEISNPEANVEAAGVNAVAEINAGASGMTAATNEASEIRVAASGVTASGIKATSSSAASSASDFGEDDDFSAELEEMEQEEEDLRVLEEIGDSIVQQVDSELENSIISIPAETVSEIAGADEEEDKKNFFARIPWWGYMIAGVVLIIAIFCIWVFATKQGKGNIVKWGSQYAAEKITYEPVAPVITIDVPDETEEDTDDVNKEDLEVIPDSFAVITPDLSALITPEPTAIPTPEAEPEENVPIVEPIDTVEVKTVYNILLIGEENINSGDYRGRSDLIMLATINTEQKAVKLTTIMRDSLVAIPGHADNRINAAYAIGGVSLLYETLKANLGVEPDNYILVNFESFEAIVDALGGVDVTLTKQEAKYLNTTNYVSKKENRTLVEGANHMNGNQVLGYCRIRKVPTASNEYSDFGRTSRQRTVLNEIYRSAAGLNYIGLLSVANKCLPLVRTDLTAEDIERYITMLLDIGIDTGIDNYRIPVKGSYSEALLRDMIVTKIDLETNAKALRTIMYGEENTAQ